MKSLKNIFAKLLPLLMLFSLQACGGSSGSKDTLAPVIVINGESTVELQLGETYTELGARAIDNKDGVVTVTISGQVDTSVLGEYKVTYSATDKAGNKASKQRTISIIPVPDTKAPVLTLNGRDTIHLLVGETYSEQGATAIDDTDGDVQVLVTGEVDTSKADLYRINYTATDAAGNEAKLSRSIVVEVPRPFITRWDTTKSGVSENNQIKIDTLEESGEYNYSVDWGDGTTQTQITGDVTHTYDSPGVYTVEISGQFPHFYMAKASVFEDGISGELFEEYQSDNQKIISVEQWGTNRWASMHSAFRNSTLTINATDTPYLMNVQDMSFMFACESRFIGCVFNQDISTWDVSNVKNMSALFACPLNDDNCGFNQDISNWDVSKVESMAAMFYRNVSFDQDIGHWDVSNVTDMSAMFFQSNFNRDISTWNVGKVNNMTNMFYGAVKYNQAMANWNVASVTSMAGMFYDATEFNQDIGSWNVGKVRSMGNMFRCRLSQQDCTFNQDISAWNVSEVVDMRGMFLGEVNVKSSFDQNIGAWQISQVDKMEGMFTHAKLSVENYDALLVGWSSQQLKSNVVFDAGNSLHSQTSNAAKLHLIEFFNWTISDAGITN